MSRQAWTLAACVVLYPLDARAADPAATYVQALNGDQWRASVLGCHAAALVIAAADGP